MEPRISIVTLGVSDLERSYRFYKEGLGFPTTRDPSNGVIFFQTGGTCLGLYPLQALAKDADPDFPEVEKGNFPGITLAHNTKTKEEVEAVLKLAEAAGGKIIKQAEDTFWGGFGGYFADPDGYLWEVAYSDDWDFHPDGSLVID